jgi:hypothetical protein
VACSKKRSSGGRAEGLAEVAEDKAKGLTELDAERAAGLTEINARRAEVHREVAAMHRHKDAQEGRVELNIGGYRFETSVRTLRRVPHTFSDAYFSTSGISWSTCATAMCRWRRLARIQACRCCVR